MNSNIITRLVILGAITIIGLIGMQSYWVISTWNINEEEFNKKVRLALLNVAKQMAEVKESSLPVKDIIKRRTSNYYVVNIEAEIDPALLKEFLRREFEQLALDEAFEYSVYDCTTDEMVYGGFYGPLIEKEKSKAELGNLPKYDEFTYYFGVKFPNKTGHLLGKMQLTITFTALVIVTIIFFAYAMFIILRQKRLSEMQKDFINNMTHEFKTPISTIKISADVFLKAPQIQEDKRLMQYARIIKEQNMRLNKQVEKVLQLASIEKGNFSLKPEVLDLTEVLNNTIQSIRIQVDKIGGTLQTDLPQRPTSIRADRLHLTNILHNLFDNAIKYCKDIPDIQVCLQENDGQLELSIKDNGIGIDQEFQHRIFDKFYRVPTGNVHNVKGFGLGLFYVKSICDAHGWRIRLFSKPEAGTEVKLYLKPLA
ncbi:MAG: HAMP domain-containing histidine kinase [Saprospiraceae bacterium]|nr:HAMP domain-containing histidine kinase [Saprospiraceae bacterium]